MLPARPNRHLTNRRIFAEFDSEHPVIRLYGTLVALELSLKDSDATNFNLKHDVCQMAVSSFPANSSIAAAATTLHGDLSALSCSGLKGSASIVRSDKYPDLRYIRFDSDFDLPASSDADIARALSSLGTLVDELRKEGLPWP
jgi:hypothetical protein